MFSINEKDADLSARLTRLLIDARARKLTLTIAALDFAAFALREDIRRREPKT